MRTALLPALLALACAAAGRASAQPPGDADVTGLPLVEVPATRPGTTLAVMMTGDGNWAEIDREVAADLAAAGIAVVGLESRTYLERRHTPDETAADVARIARHYLAAWGRTRIVLIGYSRGADTQPFIANRLPADLKARTALVAMLGPSTFANFQFHWADLLTNERRPDDVPTAPELARLRGPRVLCLFGTGEKDSLCRQADPAQVTVVPLAGEHHFERNYHELATLISSAIPPQ